MLLQRAPAPRAPPRLMPSLPRGLFSSAEQIRGRARCKRPPFRPLLVSRSSEPFQLSSSASQAQQQQQLTVQPTRLQQQIDELLAIDIECAHFRVSGQQRIAHLPAEVCLVDGRGNTVLRSHCNPLTPDKAGWEFVGGVPVAEWEAAPSLRKVRKEVAALVRGKVLVGHNLPQDLATLGLSHPKELQRDTMRDCQLRSKRRTGKRLEAQTFLEQAFLRMCAPLPQYRQLQSKRGTGKRLQALSEEKLGRHIQATGRRHDPREDALAALDLYVKHVHLDPGSMSYEDLVEHHTAEILRRAAEASAGEGESGLAAVEASGVDAGEG